MNIDPKNVSPSKSDKDFTAPAYDKNRPEEKTPAQTTPADSKSKSFQKIVEEQKSAPPKAKPSSPFELQTPKESSSMISSSSRYTSSTSSKTTKPSDTSSRQERTEGTKEKGKEKEVPKEKERIQEKTVASETETETPVKEGGEKKLPEMAEPKSKEGKMVLPEAQKEIPEGKVALSARDKSELASAEKGSEGTVKTKDEKSAKAESPMAPRADMIAGQAAPQDLSTHKAEVNQPTPTTATQRAQIAETVQALVSQITVIQSKGQTDTVIELKNPPMLEGATIKLTELSSAKGEFNITFANLKPEAKQFLDQQLLKNSLSESLEKKDIVVHQIITTTQVDPALQSSEAKPSDQQRQGREGGQGEGKGGEGGGEGRGGREGRGGQQQGGGGSRR